MHEPSINKKMFIILRSRSMHHIGSQIVRHSGVSVSPFDVPRPQSTCEKRDPFTEAMCYAAIDPLRCGETL